MNQQELLVKVEEQELQIEVVVEAEAIIQNTMVLPADQE
jgi:hypothetical protein